MFSFQNRNGHHPIAFSDSIPPDSGVGDIAEELEMDEGTPHLLFESRGVLWGVEAAAVREVLLLPEIAPLDGAPWWVGVLDVRGRIVPVVEAGELAGAPARRFQTSDSVVVLEWPHGECLGMIVERVRDVRTLFPHDVDIAPSGTASGLARLDGEIVRLLNLSSLLRFTRRENAGAQTSPERPFCPDASPVERAIFIARATALRANSATAQAAHAPSLVAVRLGGETFGFDLDWVREFAPRPLVTPVPGGPPDLLGLVNLRGEVVPLLDLRAALGLSTEGAAGEQITFIEAGGVHVGVAVEAVLDVFAPLEDALLLPPAASGAQGNAVRAAVFYGDATLAVLDLRNLLQQGGWMPRDSRRAS